MEYKIEGKGTDYKRQAFPQYKFCVCSCGFDFCFANFLRLEICRLPPGPCFVMGCEG